MDSSSWRINVFDLFISPRTWAFTFCDMSQTLWRIVSLDSGTFITFLDAPVFPSTCNIANIPRFISFLTVVCNVLWWDILQASLYDTKVSYFDAKMAEFLGTVEWPWRSFCSFLLKILRGSLRWSRWLVFRCRCSLFLLKYRCENDKQEETQLNSSFHGFVGQEFLAQNALRAVNTIANDVDEP